MKILCIIPARSGSKGIPHKNVKLFEGIPLLAHSINQAKGCNYSEQIRIIVSTDSEDYAKVANKFGAETPFLRPDDISQDRSTDLDFMKHAIEWLEKNENYCPDIILQLRPTQPKRKIEDINACLDLFITYLSHYDSLRTVVEFDKSPYKMYRIDEQTKQPMLKPLFQSVDDILVEPYNQCRQYLPKTYLHNGYIDILKTSLIKYGKLSGERIYPYVMRKTDTIDIDTMEDWEKAECG